MRILLLGASGQVGHELRRSLLPLGDLVIATRLGRLENGTVCEHADFDRPESLSGLIAQTKPDVVVNAAAYTAVDRAEQEPEIAFRINAEAPKVLAEACQKHDALLVHYSTDYVFDGTSTRPYREDDPTSPLGVYGTSKLAGEEAIRASGARHMILRTEWVYAAHGKNFMRTMLRLAVERDELRVVADQIGTPTSAALIADVTANILDRNQSLTGTWHLTASGQTSWHGFAEAIIETAHAHDLISRCPLVIPITTAEYPTPARRPGYSVLDCECLQAELGIEFPVWQDVLGQVLIRMHGDSSSLS